MFHLGTKHDEPIHDDSAQIAAHMESRQRNLRVFLSLTGAATGMYVAFATPQGLVYVGGVAGMIAFYKAFPLLMRLGRHWNAKFYEIVNHTQPPSQDD